MKPHVEFLTSAAAAEQFPSPGPPEVAFIGRSNVGKSSLLNSLVGSRIAHVSSTPGRTRTINFFPVRWGPKQPAPDLLLVDLPGYGYARLSREVSEGWGKFIDPYLMERQTLALCVVLVDVNVPPQASDRSLVEFLRRAEREFIVVATKSDKLSANQLRSKLRQLSDAYQTEAIMCYSAKTGAGRDELWKRIRETVVARSE